MCTGRAIVNVRVGGWEENNALVAAVRKSEGASMEHLPAKLARQASIGVAPKEAWEVAEAVEEEAA